MTALGPRMAHGEEVGSDRRRLWTKDATTKPTETEPRETEEQQP